MSQLEIELCCTMVKTIINAWLLNVKRDLMFSARSSRIDFGRDNKWKWSHQLGGIIASTGFHTVTVDILAVMPLSVYWNLLYTFEPLLFINKTKKASHSLKSRKNSIFIHRTSFDISDIRNRFKYFWIKLLEHNGTGFAFRINEMSWAIENENGFAYTSQDCARYLDTLHAS